MSDRRVLVTGASGYIAGRLIPRLLQAGYPVRCMVRDPGKLAHHSWIHEVEVVAADVTEPESLAAALDQVETAYYLIHNMSFGHGYQEVERRGAQHFAQAAHQAEVRHIIYLGGLVDPESEIAPHMRSRIETGEVLRSLPVPVTEFRAGVIVGPGSISFEMIRFICEQFPVLLGPTWLKNRTQPISADNVVDYLMAALDNHQGRGQVIEIGGPDVCTYADTLLLYGQARGLRRWLLTVPGIPTALMAFLVGKLTPVPGEIAYPLINGLHSSSVVTDPKAKQLFPEVELTGYRESLDRALSQLHPRWLEPLWRRANQPAAVLRSEGFIIDTRCAQAAVHPSEAYPLLIDWANEHLLEIFVEGPPESGNILAMERGGKSGRCWVEWQVAAGNPSGTMLRQTMLFAPRGLFGFISFSRWKNHQKRLLNRIQNQLR